MSIFFVHCYNPCRFTLMRLFNQRNDIRKTVHEIIQIPTLGY